MKRFFNFILILIIISVVGCNDGVRNNSQKIEQGGTTPPNPPTPPSVKELTEGDILKTFTIQKGKTTASFAAKKIKNTTLSPSSEIKFTDIRIISYDDETGEFKIQFKGTNKDGSAFDKTITFKQFTHPLKDKMIQSLNKFELSFDEAIEHNYSLDKYIEKLNENIKEKTMLKELSFMLNDSSTIIEFGEHETHTLIATATKNGNKVWVKPQVVYLKLAENTTTETTTNISNFSFTHLKAQLMKDYFAKNDVFKYILNKADEKIVIKEDKKEFASSFYAFAKTGIVAPSNMFTDEFKAYIARYADIYKEKGADEHLELKIAYGVYQPKVDGVIADDYEGSLKIKLCIATDEEIADQDKIIAIKEIEKKNGFASIPNDAALERKDGHLFFILSPKSNNLTLTPQEKTQWEKKEFKKDDSASFLLKVDENGTPVKNNPFNAADNPYNIQVNSSETNLSHLGCTTFGASKTRNEKVIFIERIRLEKLAGSKSMDVFVTLKGSNQKELKVTVTPNPY